MAIAVDNNKLKMAFSVVMPDIIIGAIFTPVLAYFADKVLTLESFKKSCSKNLVEPNLEQFEKLTKGMRRAHERHEERQAAKELRNGGELETKKERKEKTPEERAERITNSLVNFGVIFGLDFIATVGLRKLFNQVFEVESHALKTTAVDISVQLGAIALMPTLFAGASESLKRGISGVIQKLTGAPEEKANHYANITTYVTSPSILGALAGVGYNLAKPHSGR